MTVESGCLETAVRARCGSCILVGLFAALILAAGPVSAQAPRLAMEAEAAPAGWHPAFEDRFERAELGSNWRVLDGEWQLRDGRLEGRGELLVALPFAGDQRLEFDAGSDAPGDLTGTLAVGEAGFASGIFFGFASNENSRSKLLVTGEERVRLPATAVAGRGYHIVCQRRGRRIIWTANGEVLLDRELDNLPQGPRHARVGLYLWSEGWVDNVRVFLADDAAAAAVRRRLEAWQWQQDFDELPSTAAWQPDPAATGLAAAIQGDGAWDIRPGIGVGGSTALNASRPPGAVTQMVWTLPADTALNDVRCRVSIPADGSGLDMVFRAAGQALANTRVSLEEGVELRAGGGAWGRRIKLLPVLDFKPGEWYTLRHQFDPQRGVVRARLDERPWTDWVPFTAGPRAGQLDSVLFYAYESGPAGVSCRLDDLAAGATEPEDLTLRDYVVRLDPDSNTLVLKLRMLDEQGEAVFRLQAATEPAAALLFDKHEISLFSGRDDGRRVPLLRGVDVRPGTDYDVEIQFDFDSRRYRGRVGNRVWSRWFGFAGDQAVPAFERVRLIPFSPQGRAGTILVAQIYSRHTDLPPPPELDALVSQVVHNGGFETILPGLRDLDPDTAQAPPDNWIVERRVRADRVATVTQSGAVDSGHGGKRYLRVVPASDEGIRLHNLKYGGLEYEPGLAYTVSLRARAPGQEPVEIEVTPPGATVTVTDPDWQRLTWSYQREGTAAPRAGFRLHIRGGPLDIDDVSVLPAALEPPPITAWSVPSTPAVRSDDDAWPEGYRERVTVRILNAGEQPAAGVRVALELRQLWPAFRHRFAAADRIRIAAAAEPEVEVPWALLECDAAAGATARDQLVFAADCAAHGQARYHVYLRDRLGAAAVPVLPMQLPPTLQRARAAAGLDVEVTARAHSFEVEAKWAASAIQGRIRAVHATRCDAVLTGPGGETVPVELLPVADAACRWQLKAAPPQPQPGLWQLTVTAGEDTVTATLARGPCLWGAPAIQRIVADTPPRSWPVTLCAARGETERFQAVLQAGAERLEHVALTLGPFRHPDTGAPLEPRVLIRQQRTVLLPRGNASVNGTVGGYKWHAAACSRVGEYPDPLLPWRAVSVPAGQRVAAWISVAVPATAAAGVYHGILTARTATGTTLSLPVELEVFDFALPGERRFVPALGADVQGRLPAAADREQVYWDITVLLAGHGMTPWLYGMRDSPYHVPWRYDPRTDNATFDFTRMDRNLPVLIEKHNLRRLFFKFHQPGGARPGYVYDSSEDFVRLDSEQGRRMLEHWLRAVGGHLQERGWLDLAYMYIADEIERQMDTVTADLARRIRETPPGMKTWALSAVTGDWWQYMEHTDVFGGPISAVNLQRFREQGGAYWGAYNRPWFTGAPLWTTRVIGLDSFMRGASGYAHWAVTRWLNRPWVNGASSLRPAGANPDGGGSEFLFGVFAPGMDCIVYPWPAAGGPPRLPTDATVVPSIRLETLEDGIDDYEYAALLAERAAQDTTAAALLERLRGLVAAGNLGGDFTHQSPTHAVFVTDEAAFLALRSEIGRFLGRALP